MSENIGDDKRRILIIDDDPEYLEQLRTYLENDYMIGTVGFGDLAIEYISKNPTDLVLMDVQTSNQNGFSTLAAIKETEEGRNIPVVFITEKNNRNLVLDSINLGVDGYLVKPITRMMLLSRIDDILLSHIGSQNKKTILAVDDDITYLKIIRKSLKDVYNVIMLKDGALALEYLKNYTPDVFILDYQLPKVGEVSLFNIIRSRKEYDKAPVIMLLGINQKRVEKGFDEKPDKYLIKPVSKLDLVKAITSALADRGMVNG